MKNINEFVSASDKLLHTWARSCLDSKFNDAPSELENITGSGRLTVKYEQYN